LTCLPSLSQSSIQTSSYLRADELIAELFASNQERIVEESMKRESNKNRLIQEANTLGASAVPQNLSSSKDKKGKSVSPSLDVIKLDHRLGPAIRRKQGLSQTTPLPEKVKPASKNSKKEGSEFSMTGSQLPQLVKGRR
jgi:hypothetical protein